MTAPHKLAALHQIEITSRCSLKCVYCPSPSITSGKQPNRPAVDMNRATFERALSWVRHYVEAGTQSELNLAGIGESTLHPEFVTFVRLAREAVGPKVKLTFATNGIAPGAWGGHPDLDAMIRALVPYRPAVWVSLHRPEKAARAVEAYRRAGLLEGVSADPSINANTWAGQVDWFVSQTTVEEPLECQWLRDSKAMVMADGRITTCCLDASGAGVIGHVVHNEIGDVYTKPYDLCRTCHQHIPVPGWENHVRGADV